jgi:hypothetical protein
MRTALFWDITRRVVVISYRRFGTTYRSYFGEFQKSKRVKTLDPLAPTCPETSARNYHYSLRNIPEQRGSRRNVSSFRLGASGLWHRALWYAVTDVSEKYPTRVTQPENGSSETPVTNRQTTGGLQPTTPQSKQTFPVIACECSFLRLYVMAERDNISVQQFSPRNQNHHS